YVAAHLNDLIASLPSHWREKLRFGPADSDARVAALKTLSKNLLWDSIVFDSNHEQTVSCSMELLRSTILKDELTHILSRVEMNLDAFGSGNVDGGGGGCVRSTFDDRNTVSSAVTEAARMTISFCDYLMKKINASIDDTYAKSLSKKEHE